MNLINFVKLKILKTSHTNKLTSTRNKKSAHTFGTAVDYWYRERSDYSFRADGLSYSLESKFLFLYVYLFIY